MSRFCTNCGAPLEDGSPFCVHCGTANDASPSSATGAPASPSPSGTAPIPVIPAALDVAPAPGFEPPPMPSAPATPSVQNVAQTFNQQPPVYAAVPAGAPMQQGQKKSKTILICAIAIAAVALIAAACIFFFVLAPQGGTSGSGSVSASASGASASSQSSSASANETLSTEKKNAISIYERMGDLDARISACANEFNDNCLKPDRALRERCAQTAKEVYQDAISLQTTISAMSTGGAKELGDDTAHLRELGNDLVMRIQVIDEAWSRSLQYADPAAHESYILAPIVADNEGGSNKYYKHFKENYPNWNPSSS